MYTLEQAETNAKVKTILKLINCVIIIIKRKHKDGLSHGELNYLVKENRGI